MKKSLIFGILIIFLLSVIQAQVTISPNPIDISGKVGETQIHNLTITNNFNFDVFDFQFGSLSDLGFSFGNITISENSSKTLNITVTPTESFSGQKSEKVEFRFFADIPIEITTYHVNITDEITDNGFKPNYLLVRLGDTVVWHNDGEVVHKIFPFSNQDISPNEIFSHTFNSIGIFDYIDPNWDEFSSFHGVVEVISRSSQEKIHNPIYDFTWNLNINLFLNPTNIITELIDEEFQIPVNGETEGQIRIKNTGSEIAENINLSSNSDWILFKENNFDLNPDQQKFIVYEISPIIFDTEGTNKAYNITIKVKGSNTEEREEEISIFIPFSEVFSDINSAEFVFALLEKFCKTNPNNLFCNPNRNSTSSGNDSGNQTLNITVATTDFFDLKKEIARGVTTSIRQGNDLQILADQYEMTIPQLLAITNQTLQQLEENERDISRGRTLRWIGFFFIFLMVIIGVVFWKLRRVKRFENIKGGHFKYRL